MSLTEAVSSVFRNYAKFGGRALRSEYWWFQLFSLLVILAVYIVGFVLVAATRSSAILVVVLVAVAAYAIVSFIPSLAVTVRRLHDSDKSGWWLLIAFIPYVGAIVLFVFLVLPSSRGYNRYGPPYGQSVYAQRAQYWGPGRSEALRKFAEDAQGAAAAGYQPVWQEWRIYPTGEVLEVTYDVRPPDPPWVAAAWSGPQPPDNSPGGPSVG